MLNRRLATILFLSSYAPAFVLLALRSYDRSCTVFVVAVGLTCIAMLAVIAFFVAARQKAAVRLRLVVVERRNAEVAAYAATYLLPFITSFEGGWRDLLALALFFVFIGIIYVNSGMIHVNPVLAVLGFQLHEIKARIPTSETGAEDLRPQFLLTRARWLTPGITLTARQLMPDTLISLRQDEADGSQR